MIHRCPPPLPARIAPPWRERGASQRASPPAGRPNRSRVARHCETGRTLSDDRRTPHCTEVNDGRGDPIRYCPLTPPLPPQRKPSRLGSGVMGKPSLTSVDGQRRTWLVSAKGLSAASGGWTNLFCAKPRGRGRKRAAGPAARGRWATSCWPALRILKW